MFWTFVNVLMLLVPIFFALFLLRIERKDIKCEVLDDVNTCHGDGMSWAGSRPSENDSVSTLLNKIKKAANAETHSIKWRRAFLLAVVMVYIFVVLNLAFGEKEECNFFTSIPDCRNVFILISIFFIVLYFTYDYYSYHIYSIPREHIRNSVKYIGKKLTAQ